MEANIARDNGDREMSNYNVVINGYDVNVVVESFNPGCPPITNRLPEDCDPGDPGEIEFKIDSGNELLDSLIEENEDLLDEIEDQLWDQLTQEAKDGRY